MNTTPQEFSKPKTILLVEDNDSYRQIVSASLSRWLPEYRVVEADSVTTARAAAVVETLDVAVLDMTLPDGMATDIIEGWQQRMKDGLQVVVFSSYEAEEVAPALHQLGIHEYVNKEKGIKPLVHAVQAAAQRSSGKRNESLSHPGNTVQADGFRHS